MFKRLCFYLAVTMCLAPLLFAFITPNLATLRAWQYVFVAGVLISAALIRNIFSLLDWSKQQRIAVLAGFFVLFVTSIVFRYVAVDIDGVDFSIFDYMLFNTARGNFGFSPIYEVNHFAVHPSWTLLLLLPGHFIFTHPLYLLVMGSILMAAAVIPLWFLAKSHQLTNAQASLISLAYLGSATVGTIVNHGFRIEMFIPLGLFTLLWSFHVGRTSLWLPALFFTLAIKEDLALYLVPYFAVLGILNVTRRRAAWSAAGISIFYFLMHLAYILPALRGPNDLPTYVGFWRHYGDTIPAIASYLITHPIDVLTDIARSGIWKFYAPLVFISGFSLPVFVASLPGIVILGTATGSRGMHQFSGYYPLILFCFALLAFIHIFERLNRQAIPVVWIKRFGPSLLAFVLLIYPLWGSGFIKIAKPDLEVLAQTHSLKSALQPPSSLTGDADPVCLVSVLFPYLGYENRFRLVSDDCLKRHNASVVFHTKRNPYPWDQETLKKIHFCTTPLGTLPEIPSNELRIVPAAEVLTCLGIEAW